MKKIILILFSLFSSGAFAEEWLCTDQASERRGNSILACGVGESENEAKARDLALQSAKKEFRDICNVSDDCQGHAVIVEPKRTQCKDGKCYRLIVFHIQAKETQQAPIIAKSSDPFAQYRDPDLQEKLHAMDQESDRFLKKYLSSDN